MGSEDLNEAATIQHTGVRRYTPRSSTRRSSAQGSYRSCGRSSPIYRSMAARKAAGSRA